jgi:hypothetical protein
MLDADPQLKQQFNTKIKQEPEFESNDKTRLNWLYQQTPFYDNAYLKYPILIQAKN